MFKKMLCASVILATCSGAALADTTYVGGSLGVTNFGVHSNGSIQGGAIGKLFGGYGSLYGVNRNIYLGGELNLDVSHYPYHSGTNYGAGVSFIPGVMITNDTMVYGRVGLEAQYNKPASYTRFGNQLGLGLQTSFKKNWDVRAEYVHTANLNASQVNLGLVYKFES